MRTVRTKYLLLGVLPPLGTEAIRGFVHFEACTAVPVYAGRDRGTSVSGNEPWLSTQEIRLTTHFPRIHQLLFLPPRCLWKRPPSSFFDILTAGLPSCLYDVQPESLPGL